MAEIPPHCDTHQDIVAFKYPSTFDAKPETSAENQDRDDWLVVDGGRGRCLALSGETAFTTA
ncbi:MAG: hypothetical protein E6G71_05115 [Alphaproteobacteria bacterium]|nr:MAG: hypothetical protein E6G71_05115 [Alphaproteobacteria bacterium]